MNLTSNVTQLQWGVRGRSHGAETLTFPGRGSWRCCSQQTRRSHLWSATLEIGTHEKEAPEKKDIAAGGEEMRRGVFGDQFCKNGLTLSYVHA